MRGEIDKTQPNVVTWSLFKKESGRRINILLTVNAVTGEILQEQRSAQELAPRPAPPVALPESAKPMHVRLGIPVEVQVAADGTRTLVAYPNRAPDSTKKLMEFFDDTKPNPFPELEKLHQQYRQELAELKRTNCIPCEEGALMQKYQGLILDHQHDAQTTAPADQGASPGN